MCWKPDGLVFAVGCEWFSRRPSVEYTCEVQSQQADISLWSSALINATVDDDGCIAIWAVEDSDKPLSVRTITQEDVNITDAEEVR